MLSYIRYKKQNGQIVCLAHSNIIPEDGGEFGHMPVSDSSVQYCMERRVDLESMEIVEKLDFDVDLDRLSIVADGEDEATLSGIPAGTLVYVAGQEAMVDDGILQFSIDLAGTYKITLFNPIYNPMEVEIEAVS